jgi:orotate phosphoribosyltransferase
VTTEGSDGVIRMAAFDAEDTRRVFEDAGAILGGHFVLTSGKHSDTYLQCARVLEDPGLTTTLAQELVTRLPAGEVDLVAAPAVGGIVIGFAVAQALQVRFIFSEREDGRMRLRRGFVVPDGARVLIVEDVVTTGGSVAEVADLVREQGGRVVGVAALVDRGGEKRFTDPLWSLLRLEVEAWDRSECRLCASGEPVSSPGSRRLGG